MEQLKTLTLVSLIAVTPVLAVAGATVGDQVGLEEAQIRTTLEAQGYKIQEIEFEDDAIEVEVTIDGVESELVLSLTDGTVVEVEIEEGDDD